MIRGTLFYSVTITCFTILTLLHEIKGNFFLHLTIYLILRLLLILRKYEFTTLFSTFYFMKMDISITLSF